MYVDCVLALLRINQIDSGRRIPSQRWFCHIRALDTKSKTLAFVGVVACSSAPPVTSSHKVST
jgi:hypothetical protein